MNVEPLRDSMMPAMNLGGFSRPATSSSSFFVRFSLDHSLVNLKKKRR